MADDQVVAGAEQQPMEEAMSNTGATTLQAPADSNHNHNNNNTTSSSTSPTATAAHDQSSPSPTAAAPSEPQPPPTLRQQPEALGPATDDPIANPDPSSTNAAAAATTTTASASSGPFLSISLMLTTGARHPYRIDEKYLRSRRVEVRGAGAGGSGSSSSKAFDPRELSGYQLKELIWTDWRGEWEPRPASPSSIRLIIMGRMIEDKAALKEFPFSLEGPNVVHMTVKPADLVDDDETGGKGTGKGGAGRNRDGEEQGAGCRCVVS